MMKCWIGGSLNAVEERFSPLKSQLWGPVLSGTGEIAGCQREKMQTKISGVGNRTAQPRRDIARNRTSHLVPVEEIECEHQGYDQRDNDRCDPEKDVAHRPIVAGAGSQQ